jgi:hypothetical protein
LTPEDTYRKVMENGEVITLYPIMWYSLQKKMLAAKKGKNGDIIKDKNGKPIPYREAGYIDLQALKKKIAEQ